MKQAFTLIELLIVVAIIAILAAIAVPNFLEAQVRAKVSRMKADMRTLSTGLDIYRTDFNGYPLCNIFSLAGARPAQGETLNNAVNQRTRVLERISTPVAYLSNSFIADVFKPNLRRSSFSGASPQGTPGQLGTDLNREIEQLVKYTSIHTLNLGGFADVEKGDGPAKSYILQAAGPARAYANIAPLLSSSDGALIIKQAYDPTNGTSSYGYVWRFGGEPPSKVSYATTFFQTLMPITSK